MRKFWIALMILTLVPALGLVQAEGSDRGSGHGGKGKMMKALDLDKDQLAKMRKLRSGMKRKMIEQRSIVDLARLDFQEELQKDKPDTAKLNKLIDQIAEAKAQKTRARLTMHVEMTKILTQEQKQKMLERMGSRMMGSGGGMGHGKGYGGRHERRDGGDHKRHGGY